MEKPFSKNDEVYFKQSFVISFLASYEVERYEINCNNAWKNHSMIVEDAVFLANVAWKELKEKVGLNDT